MRVRMKNGTICTFFQSLRSFQAFVIESAREGSRSVITLLHGAQFIQVDMSLVDSEGTFRLALRDRIR